MPSKAKAIWTIVGAGPAGIAAVGKLLDNGILPSSIQWIDPNFKVGLLGAKWSSVSSNTTVELFEKFLTSSPSFEYNECERSFKLHLLKSQDTCELRYVVDPLHWVTEKLLSKVVAYRDFVTGITRSGDHWTINLSSGTLFSENVVLAIGSKPKEMKHDIPVINLEDALQINELKKKCTPNDTIAVFGSSHSAIMIVRDLLQLPVKRVINFYRHDLIYAEYLPEGIVNDSSGLKGNTAKWARENITQEDTCTESFQRYLSNDETIAKYLNQCDKAIYAIGFQQQPFSINNTATSSIPYNPTTGKIDDGLYGVGIAFPEQGPDAIGNLEYQVGLWKFMRYLTRIVPQWIKEAKVKV